MAFRGGGGFGASARGRGGGCGRGGPDFAGSPGPPPPYPSPNWTPSFAPSPASLPHSSPTPHSTAAVPHVDPTPAERPAKRTRFDFGEDITVLVGADEKKYTVHKRVVCLASNFFRAACDGEWKESKERIVRLPEIEPEIFDVYHCWIYMGEIDVVSETADTQLPHVKYEKGKPIETLRAILMRLAKAFALGDMLQDIHFTNTIIDEFVAFEKVTVFIPNTDSITIAWNATMHDSSFMRALVDWIAVRMPATIFDQNETRFPPGFVAEVAKACMRDRELPLSTRGIFNRPRCFYHDHKGGAEVGKTKCCEKGLSSASGN